MNDLRAAVLVAVLMGAGIVSDAALGSSLATGSAWSPVTVGTAFAQEEDDPGDDDDYSPSNEEAMETAEEGVDIPDDEEDEIALEDMV